MRFLQTGRGGNEEQERDRAGLEKDMFNNKCLLVFVIIVVGIVGSLVGFGVLVYHFV